MPAYRVELAKLGRAVCKSAECKTNGIKIEKGSLRFGTLVEINEHSSWMWKHWGCVTPKQLDNWKELSGGDPELLDGLEDLPQDLQEKIVNAVEAGHVADEDWRGDPEMNRPGAKAVRKKKSKKDQAEDQSEDGDAEKKKRKRGKKDVDVDVDDEAETPALKKARNKSKKVDTTNPEEDTAPAPKKRSRAKKAKEDDGEAVPAHDNDASAQGPPRKGAKGNAKNPNQPSKVADDDVPTKSKRGRKKGEDVADDSTAKPKRASRAKKA